MFVRRKCIGNVPNRSQANGPVNIWQASVNAAASHTFLGKRAMNERVASLPGSGYHAFILGKSVMMPAMARYESWNPADSRTDGLTAICIINAAQKVWTGLLFRCSRCAVSLMSMKRNARTSEGAAPVTMV